MNEVPDHISDATKRAELMDICFGLYENLSDLLSDLVIIDGGYSDESEVGKAIDRMHVAVMDTLGDMDMLRPRLHRIRQSLSRN